MSSKPDIRFIINLAEDNTFGDHVLKVNVNVVVMTAEGIRNPQFGYSDDTGAGQYADLEIRGLYSASSEDFYGRDPEYFQPYSVDVRRADSMAKTLKRIYASLKRQDERLGAPTDFAAYAARLAVALGCQERACFGRRESERNGSTYSENYYRWMDTDSLRMHLGNKTREWRQKYFPQEVSS
jgi:hypothetical protein